MYKSGYTLNLYKILEDDVINFLNYIPLTYYLNGERKEIFSPKLAELLIRIGSQVDIFFRNWDITHSSNIGAPVNKLSIGNYKAIETKINLKDKEIKILSTNEIIMPFKDWIVWKPDDENWWNAYNHVKHNGFTNKKEGNFFNVIESLAALFLLNCLHKDAKEKLIEYGYYEFSPEQYREYIINKLWLNPLFSARSQLFEYEKKKIMGKIEEW